jgi:DNA-binding NtrC family response regulator
VTTNPQVLPFSMNRVPRPAAVVGDVGATWPILAGSSVAATQLRSQIRRVAPHFRTAVLTGEPGCGDEQVARALHGLSPAARQPLVVLGAAEAEQRFAGPAQGVGMGAAEGMVYLPEAARLSRTAQAGLLAQLQGAHAWQHYQAQPGSGRGLLRVVAFAGSGLRPLVSAGGFSAELAGVLEALRVAVPRLRERAEDIPHLMSYMAQRMAEDLGGRTADLSSGFLEEAARFDWPGNLAQMRAAMRLLLERSADVPLQAGDLAEALDALAAMQPVAPVGPRLVKLEQVVQEHVRSVLIGCNGNKLRAAEVLGISRSTLYRMLESTGGDSDWPLAG